MLLQRVCLTCIVPEFLASWHVRRHAGLATDKISCEINDLTHMAHGRRALAGGRRTKLRGHQLQSESRLAWQRVNHLRRPAQAANRDSLL